MRAVAMTGIEGVGEPSEPVAQGGVAFVEATVAGDVIRTPRGKRVSTYSPPAVDSRDDDVPSRILIAT